MPPIDAPFELIKREEWGARPSTVTGYLRSPADMVRFVFRTAKNECFTKEECIKAVQELQKHHQYDMHLPDINLNFLVGGDNNVYEGRGWNKAISRLPSHASRKVLGYLTIGYIGDFVGGKVPTHMQDVAYSFLRAFSKEGLIHPSVLALPNKVKLTCTL